jgi:hypothetical protein
MTDRLALVIVLLVVVAIGADLLANDGAATMFVTRKFLDLVEWVAFWR